MIDYINGTFSLILVSISFIVGIILIFKYFKTKEKIFVLVGLSWIFIVEPWFPSTFAFLCFLLTNKLPPDRIYLLLGTILLPFTLLIWIYAFTEFMSIKKQKLILILLAIIGVVYEIYLMYYWISDPYIIGFITGPVDVNYNIVVNIYLISLLILVEVTGIIFARATIRSPELETKLKGKLLLIAWLLFLCGSILDIISANSILILSIARIILIISALAFYSSFNLPNRMKKLFGIQEL